MNKIARMLAVLALLVVVTGACSSGNDAASGTTGSPTGTTTGTSPAPSETAGGTPTVEAHDDNTFAPATLAIAAGQQVKVVNGGSLPHTFTIQGQGIDVTVSKKGDEATADTSKLAPGTYTFVCKFHPGMDGKLTVA